VRGDLTKLIAEHGHAPTTARLSEAAKLSVEETEASLRRLHGAHSLLLHPGTTRPWVVHPFALSAGSCWVETPERGYWATCLFCAFGIAAALRCDAVVTTRYGGEAQTVEYRIGPDVDPVSGDLFHLSTPVRHWWDNVIHACASFQPFARETDVHAWCERHDLPRGATMSVPQLWRLASDWYGGYLREPWRKRSSEEVRTVFERHGLTGDFWRVS
jgi:hypothetical protein